MNDREVIDRLRIAEWPMPSPELRNRVAAIAVRPPAIVWTDRVWYSRAFRLGAAAVAMAAITLDVWGAQAAVPANPRTIAAQVETKAIEDLVRSAGMPDDAARSIAGRQSLVSRATPIDRASLIAGDDQ
ncbi:MAG TPA: hypothetical protein VN700_14725 [Vicinamibacterales bacterium]|nr:hypothetical protein [Vicinamibacterales bacterium]